MDADKNITVHVDVSSVIKAVFAIIGIYVLFLLRDLVLVVLTAVVIAAAIEPATRWLTTRRLPRIVAVIVIYLALAVALSGTFYFLVPPLVDESSSFISRVPAIVESLPELDAVQRFDTSTSNAVLQQLNASEFRLDSLFANLGSGLSQIPSGVLSAVSNIFGGVLSFVLIVVISFYLAVQKDGIENFLRIVIPYKHQAYGIDLWRRSQRRIGLWMQGQVLLVVLIGVLVYLGLAIVGVRHAFLFALLAGLFELIPLFGPILASIPAITVGFIDGGVTLALVVAAIYAIIQQFENHLIYPLVVHKVVGVPALLVILALIIGAQLAGFMGILLAVPIATALVEVVNDIQKRNKHLAEKDQANKQ